MKKILLICESNLSTAPRVIRTLNALKQRYRITTLGTASSNIDGIEHISFEPQQIKPKHWDYPYILKKTYSALIRIFRFFSFLYTGFYFENDYWTTHRKHTFNKLKNYSFDLVIAHHTESLPIAVKLSIRYSSKLIYNIHDYYTREFETNNLWVKNEKPYVEFLTKKYIKYVDLVFAAWPKIAEDFYKLYGIECLVFNNAIEYQDLNPQIPNSSKIRIIHHGVANSDREIELSIKLMDFLDERFSIDFILIASYSEQAYFEEIKKLAKSYSRIRILDPVPTLEIPKRINDYDIGLFFLPQTNINETYTLPNKLFEFIQARLCIAIGPSIEMEKIIKEYDLGIVSKDFDPKNLADELNNLDSWKILYFKNQCHKYAKELSSEKNYEIVRQVVDNLLKKH